MKTMSINSAAKKLAKAGVSKTSVAYKNAIAAVNGAKTLRPCYTSCRGHFTSNQDHTTATTDLLKALGIEFTLTNDAPRGSATGNLITITTKIR